MACRVGITTDLKTRKAHWETACKNLRNWQKSKAPFNTKEEAQAAENSLAKKHGCDSAPGGDDPDDPNAKWWLYFFEHDGCSK